MTASLRVAIADDEPAMRAFLNVALSEMGHRVVVSATTGRELVEGCLREEVDLIIADIRMPELSGLEAIEQIVRRRQIPAIIISAYHDAEMIERAAAGPVVSYLVKPVGHADLEPAITVAVRRFQEMQALRAQSLTDELTGLYNRRGFLQLAGQHIHSARRQGRSLLLGMADIDGLKEINDHFGHHEGDEIIRAAAEALKATFRASDILARIGGDEFVVLGTVAPGERMQEIERRLQRVIAVLNEGRQQRHANGLLAMSLGTIQLETFQPDQVDELLGQADKLLYSEKERRRASRVNTP